MKVKGSGLIQPTPIPMPNPPAGPTPAAPSEPFVEFLLSAKTLGELNDIFFYVGIPDNVGISYAFASTKLAGKSPGA
jgi:hypothetical protein